MPFLSQPLENIIVNDTLRDIMIISLIFILTLIIWRIISVPLLKIFKSTSIGYLDKLLGFLFGVARILILACIIYIYTLLPNEKEFYPEFAKNSKLLPIIEGISLLITENFEIFDIRPLNEIKSSELETSENQKTK